MSHRRNRLSAELSMFVQQYGRRAQRGVEPNDRGYSREIEALMKRLPPEELSELLNSEEEQPAQSNTPNMKLGYTIIYVPQVSKTLEFFEKAFGLRRKFLHESGDSGELDTGETTLAFASHELGQANFPKGYIAASDSLLPLGVEIAFTTDDVHAAFDAAVAAGAKAIKNPEVKPWGQTIAYVRCPDGTLIELCTPMGE